MKILVTGAGGMVGSHLIENLYSEGHDVLGTYYKPTTDLSEICSNINIKELDVRYYESVYRTISEFRPTQIYHLAAQSYPTVSWNHPQATIDTNIIGTINVFEAIKFVRKIDNSYDPMVIVACSSAEYGQTLEELAYNGKPYVRETDALKPLHPYGVSKVGQDLISYQYYMNDHIKCIRARIFNSTGTRKVNDVTADLTYRTILMEKNQENVLRVGNTKTKRAIMDQRDLIQALKLLIEKGTPGEVYNICSETVYEVTDIINIIQKLTGYHFQLMIDNELLRPTDEKIIVGDISKLKKVTGWEQKISMEQTIKDMLDYWRIKLR